MPQSGSNAEWQSPRDRKKLILLCDSDPLRPCDSPSLRLIPFFRSIAEHFESYAPKVRLQHDENHL